MWLCLTLSRMNINLFDRNLENHYRLFYTYAISDFRIEILTIQEIEQTIIKTKSYSTLKWN
jgi:hypothetical protein